MPQGDLLSSANQFIGALVNNPIDTLTKTANGFWQDDGRTRKAATLCLPVFAVAASAPVARHLVLAAGIVGTAAMAGRYFGRGTDDAATGTGRPNIRTDFPSLDGKAAPRESLISAGLFWRGRHCTMAACLLEEMRIWHIS